MQLSRAALAVALAFVSLHPAHAETITLDLAGALVRAHRAAPASALARGELREAEAAVAGAAVPFVSNPELELGGGPRFSTPRKLDLDARISQDLDLGRRGPRRALAAAEVTRARATVDAAARTLDLEVAFAFYATLHADRAIELAQHAAELASRAADAADRRRRAGDVTDLDVGLARAAAGRARAALEAAQADRAATAGRLAQLVGATADDTIAATGELRATSDLAAVVADRADLRALAAARRVGELEADVARAEASTALGVWLGYAREEANAVVLAGVRLTLPAWNRGEGARARADAHVATAREQLAIATRTATREVADARAAFAHARAAVETYERDVLPALDAAEQLLDKSIAAGQLAVADYLVARQELASGRREYLDRLLALAEAHATLGVAAGGAP